MKKVVFVLPEPLVFDETKNLPNFIGCVKESDLASQCFVEYSSNVKHISTFKVRMPLGWSYEIEPIFALPNKTNSSS